jgi:MFS family permease
MSINVAAARALSFPQFRLFLAMRMPAALAIQMQSVAVGWEVYDMTHRPLSLGLVGLAQFVPVFGFSLIAGHVADRFDRRRILLICITLQFLCAALLSGLAASGARNVWAIYAILGVFGVARAFSGPATQSLLPNLVPRDQLNSAFALNASFYQSMTIAGPAVGGFAYAWGAPVVFTLAAAMFLVSLSAGLTLKSPAHVRISQSFSWETLLAGIAFIRSRREILGAISLDLFAVLFGGATALLPIYARDVLDVGPLGLGLLRSAPAMGAVAMGLRFARRPPGRHAGPKMFAGIAVFGAMTVAFGVSRNFALSLACLIILGAADMVSVFVRQNLVQRSTPDSVRGRVNAVSFLFVGASNELGEMESGLTADWFGAVPAVVLGGLCSLTVLAIWMWRFPQLRQVDRLEDIRPAA